MQSESTAAIAAALAKAQGQIRPAVMDRDNPYFKNRYATLTALWDAARAALAANGLAVAQTTDVDANGNVALITTLMHASGEWIGGVYPVRAADNKPQSLGSAITYARRYAFAAILGLVSDDDDDGNAANAANGNEKEVTQRTTNGNGGGANVKRQPAPPTASPDDDFPFDDDEEARLRDKLHAIGGKLYGKDWEAKRHELAGVFSKGRTHSSKDLTLAELRTFVTKLDERQRAAVPA